MICLFRPEACYLQQVAIWRDVDPNTPGLSDDRNKARLDGRSAAEGFYPSQCGLSSDSFRHSRGALQVVADSRSPGGTFREYAAVCSSNHTSTERRGEINASDLERV